MWQRRGCRENFRGANRVGVRAVNSEDGKSGLGSAVSGLMEGDAGPPVPNSEQLPLLPEAGESQGAIQNGDGQTPERRGPGRPPGSKNKRTEDWTEYILGKYTSPLEFLAKAYTADRDQLAKDLGCDKLDAYKLQIQAARELAPYVHQKQPMAVQMDAKGRVILIASGLPDTPGISVDALAALGLGVNENGSVTTLDGEAIVRDDEEDSEE